MERAAEPRARRSSRAPRGGSLGSKCATKPQPPATVLPSSSTSTSPAATTIQARSWTWCSWSPSPAGRLIAITRASGSLRRTSGWCGWTSSEARSQVSMPGNLISAWPYGYPCRMTVPAASAASPAIAISASWSPVNGAVSGLALSGRSAASAATAALGAGRVRARWPAWPSCPPASSDELMAFVLRRGGAWTVWIAARPLGGALPAAGDGTDRTDRPPAAARRARRAQVRPGPARIRGLGSAGSGAGRLGGSRGAAGAGRGSGRLHLGSAGSGGERRSAGTRGGQAWELVR